MKKGTILIVGISLFLLFIIIVLSVIFTHFSKDKLIIKGYYSSIEHWDKEGFQDYVDYCKYFYNESYDINFKKNNSYQIVKSKDIENIKEYFDNFKQFMESGNRLNEYDFDNNFITEGDYFHIRTKEGEKIGDSYYDKFDNYTVYFYDIETHTLFYIHANI